MQTTDLTKTDSEALRVDDVDHGPDGVTIRDAAIRCQESTAPFRPTPSKPIEISPLQALVLQADAQKAKSGRPRRGDDGLSPPEAHHVSARLRLRRLSAQRTIEQIREMEARVDSALESVRAARDEEQAAWLDDDKHRGAFDYDRSLRLTRAARQRLAAEKQLRTALDDANQLVVAQS